MQGFEWIGPAQESLPFLLLRMFADPNAVRFGNLG
ncbi:hypothetical protein N183_27685 [Sinorhizobium sp. Sb3]|nr:hypothetical protein N183_27685 [Sinorhizobium sp. Sb3]